MVACPHCNKEYKRLDRHLRYCVYKPITEDKPPIQTGISKEEREALIGRLMIWKNEWPLSEDQLSHWNNVIEDLVKNA